MTAEQSRTVRGAKIVAALVLIGLAIGFGRTMLARTSNAKTLEAAVVEHQKLYVKVATPRTGAGRQELALPGSLQGFVQSPIAARASGYLKRWHVDIGTRVQKGQLLAEIETPEIDQQLSQAMAAREQAAASLALASSTLERWEGLRRKDAVSQQELDEKRGGEAQAKANLAAADANVERLKELTSFKRIVAPFAGVITRRNVDHGDLIDAGGGAGRTLFVLTQTDPLRVYVNVPQAQAQRIKPGQKVKVVQAEVRGQEFEGEIARTAGAIDAASRTMQVEVTLRNKDGALLPGAYVQVLVPLASGDGMTIPTSALLIRGEGTRVATVDASGKVALKRVTLGRNYGESIEVIDGVAATDRLVLNPPDSLVDGDQVVIAPAADTKKGKS